MLPAVSIIIPIYNTPSSYLKECVMSVWNQTYKNIHIILIDDGSEKECARFCDTLVDDLRSSNKNKITVVHTKNRGVSNARNIGLANADGQYVCFVDADDCVHPEYVNILVSACEKTGSSVASCRYKKVAGNIKIDTHLIGSDKVALYEKSERYNDYSGVVWNKIFRLKDIKSIRFDSDIFYCEDGIFMNEVMLNTKTYAVTDYLGYYHRINMSDSSSKFNSLKFKQALYMCDIVLKNKYVAANHNYYDSMKRLKAQHEIRLMVSYAYEKPSDYKRK